MADTAPVPRVKRPLWRRIARGSAIVIGSLVALVVLLLGFLHTPWGKSLVRARIEHKLAAAVNGKVKLGSLDYSFLFGEIRLGDIEIDDPQGQRAIGLGSLAVDLDRASLLAGEPVLDDVRIAGLDVRVDKHADGTTNLTGLFKSSKQKPPSHIRIDHLGVAGDATLTKPDGTKIVVTDLALSGSVDARPATHELELALASVAAKVDLSAPGAAPKHVDVAIDDVKVGRHRDALDVDVRKAVLGALSIDGIGAHVRVADGHLQGVQAITIAKARLDSKQLAKLVGHELLVDDVHVAASVTGPANHLAVSGTVQTRDARLALSGVVDAAAVRPTYELSLVGTGLSSDLVANKLPTRVETALRIDLKGAGRTPVDIDAELSLAIGPTTIGKLAVDDVTARATAHRGTYRLESFSARGLGFELAATGDMAADKTVNGRLVVRGNPAHAIEVLASAGIAVPRRVPLLHHVELAVNAHGRIDGPLALELEPMRLAIAGGTVSLSGVAQLDHKVLQSASTHIKLAKLDLAALARLTGGAGKQPKLHGSLSASLALTRTATSQHAEYAFDIGLPKLQVLAKGTADATSARTHADVIRISDRTVLGTLDAQLALDAKGVRRTGPWSVAIDLPRRSLAELAALLPKPPSQLPAGDVEAHVALAGTPARPTGTLSIVSQNLDVHGTLSSSARGLALITHGTATLDGSPLAIVDAILTAPAVPATGKLDVAALKAGAMIDATIDIPEREALAESIDGFVGGHVTLRGAALDPTVDARLRWHGYKTASGGIGETTLTAAGTSRSLTAKLEHGGGALAITAAVERSADRIAVRAIAHAGETPLRPLIPAFAATKLGANDPGKLRWDMQGTFALARTATGWALAEADVTGALEVQGGSLAIPNSGRQLHDIGLKLAADPHGVRLESLALHESDIENRDRRIEASGSVAFVDRRPNKAHLALVAHDWLLFGTPTFGPADAPRAAADFDLGVDVDLGSPITAVDATVHRFTLRAPERFERAHQAEQATVSGDIIYVSKSAPVGRLPVIAAEAPEPPRHRHPMDIKLHIPSPIHLVQTPFDVMAHGELAVTVRDEGVTTRGTLKADSGTLFLFGHVHQLVAGTVSFTDEHPHGWMDLTFDRKLPDATMRDLARTPTGARIVFVGPPTKPKVSLAGAANASLNEVMAMHNAGRGIYVTRPDLPASETAQAPRGDQLSVLTYMATNLPHLMFLDKISAWADPYRSPYGRIENVEAEKYGRHSRVRAVMRPQTPGRSTSELQYDRLLIQSDRAAAGVGLRAGDRLGGGVGVFVEWSSKQ